MALCTFWLVKLEVQHYVMLEDKINSDIFDLVYERFHKDQGVIVVDPNGKRHLY